MKHPPKLLIEHAAKIGRDLDLVQMSGGNVSMKIGTKIWVKASGKKLSEAKDENIFCRLNITEYPHSKLMTSETFLTDESENLVPSIETNFHILFPFKFVTHLHSLGSVALSIAKSTIDCFDFESLGVANKFIQYAKPGKELALKLSETNSVNSNIIFLQNHGVIFASNDLDLIEHYIEKVENAIKVFYGVMRKEDTYPDWIQILIGGVLTPDEAVFLGEKPFVKSQKVLENSIGINSNGDLIFPDDFSADRVEIAHFYVRVAKLIERKSQIQYLPEHEVRKLLDWDKEKIRISMAK